MAGSIRKEEKDNIGGSAGALTITGLNKVFTVDDKDIEVLDNIGLDVGQGEFISIVGASGCGKSTLLRIIGGLEDYTDGVVASGGKEVHGPSGHIGMIFQESRLFPWLKIADNIAFGIGKENRKRLSKKAQAELVQKYLELVNLVGFENAYPHQLSGGMQQRISIARALIENPDILLLDEPFGALDALTRINMQNEVLHIWEKEKKTMILVTHDIDEAIFLSDRIVVMSNRPGHIKKIIDVKMSRPRDRSSFDFIKIRTEIFKIFFAESSLEIEYYI